MPTIEPGRATANAVAIDCSVPTHSSAASTPMPPVSSSTASVASSPRASTMSVAPNTTGHLLPVSVAAQRDDALRAEPPGRQDGAQADGAVPDHRHRVALLRPRRLTAA